jgi:hypothetical protein
MAGKGGRRSTSFKPGNKAAAGRKLRAINGEPIEPAQAKRIIADLKAAARELTHDALTRLHTIMMSDDAPPAACVAAANSILDRGWGGPTQTVESDVGPTLADLVLQSYRGRTVLPVPVEALTLEAVDEEKGEK